MNFISIETQQKAAIAVEEKHGTDLSEIISKGVTQVARFWQAEDGTLEDYIQFCIDGFLATEAFRQEAFQKISRNIEIVMGNFNCMSVGLKEPLHMSLGKITPIDQLFGGYEPSSHLAEDFFSNKIAFFILLNFPFYALNEKEELGETWNREQWAMARLGQYIDSRVPGELMLKYAEINTLADSYISEYNIYMGNLRNNSNEAIFPDDLKLISHWGLRDELKANYGRGEAGLEKQRLIYQVMLRIIRQEIPQEVINSPTYEWNPIENTLSNKAGNVPATPEPDTRYDWLLRNFHALKEMDATPLPSAWLSVVRLPIPHHADMGP